MKGDCDALVVAVGEFSTAGKILSSLELGDDDENEKNVGPERGHDEDQDTSVRPHFLRHDSLQSITTSSRALIYEDLDTSDGNEEVAEKEVAHKTGSILMSKIDALTLKIGKVGTAAAAFVFAILVAQYVINHDGSWSLTKDSAALLKRFILAITVLVVAVPEGLPLAITLALAVSLRKMSREHNQVKHLESCETMGSVTTICSDKTGTLTENRMKIASTVFGVVMVENDKYVKVKSVNVRESNFERGRATKDSDANLLALPLAFSTLCTSHESEIKKGEKGDWVYAGNPTDCAMLRWCEEERGGTSPEEYFFQRVRKSVASRTPAPLDPSARPAERWARHTIPFTSERKMMSVLIGEVLLSKGALSSILQRCEWFYLGDDAAVETGGGSSPAPTEAPPGSTPSNFIRYEERKVKRMNDSVRSALVATAKTEETRSHRVIALAFRPMKFGGSNGKPNSNGNGATLEETLESNLIFYGFVGIQDPLRHGIRESVERCLKAGVTVRMLTGDSLDTAKAIAQECGILDGERGENDDHDEEEGRRRGKPGRWSAMTGAEFDERVHRLDERPEAETVARRRFDIENNTESFGDAKPFLLDANGKKILNHEEFARVARDLRVLVGRLSGLSGEAARLIAEQQARCMPEDKLALVRGLREVGYALDDDDDEEERAARSSVGDETVSRATSRHHKQRRRVSRKRREIVAVTGDGTNDAPALRAADVGFAMGISGTEVAKAACDIVLLDDSFKSVVTAIVWGRNVQESVSRFLQFQLTVNVAAILIVIASALDPSLSSPGLNAAEMLWVNMIMDSLGSIALATEEPNVEVLLSRGPTPRTTPVVTSFMSHFIVLHAALQFLVTLSLMNYWPPALSYLNLPAVVGVRFFSMDSRYFEGVSHSDSSFLLAKQNAILFNSFVCMQLFNQINSRSVTGSWKERTSNLFPPTASVFALVLTFEALAQVALVQYLHSYLRISPLELNEWAFCLFIGSLALPVQAFLVDPLSRRYQRAQAELSTAAASKLASSANLLDSTPNESSPLIPSSISSASFATTFSRGNRAADNVRKPTVHSYRTLMGGDQDREQSSTPATASSGTSDEEAGVSVEEEEALKRKHLALRRWGLIRNAILFGAAVSSSSSSKRKNKKRNASPHQA